MMSLKQRLRRAKYNRSFNVNARSILNGIQANLSKQDRALCDAYAIDVLGSRAYAPWLYIYSVTAGGFREGWIPDNYYGQYVVRRTSYKGLASKRALGARFFGNDHFPDLAYCVDGTFVAASGEVLHADALMKLLFDRSDKVIFKSDNSLQGLGIRFFTKAKFDVDTLKIIGNGVFQHVIRQHDIFDPLSSNSLTTLRFTTAINDQGVASVRGSFLRFGRAEDTHIKSATMIKVPFDRETGCASDLGFLPDWNPITRHPDTGGLFAGIQIPNFDACVALVTQLHRRFPFIQCLGWDVAIDQDGHPHVLEWNNGHNEIKFGEATQGPCFRDLDWADRWRTS